MTDYQMYIWPAACTDATKHLAGKRYPLTDAELKDARKLGMTPSAYVIAREVTRASKDVGSTLDRKPPTSTRKASPSASKPASSIPRLSEDERRVARMFAMSDEAYVAHREQLAAQDREAEVQRRRRELYAEDDED